MQRESFYGNFWDRGSLSGNFQVFSFLEEVSIHFVAVIIQEEVEMCHNKCFKNYQTFELGVVRKWRQ